MAEKAQKKAKTEQASLNGTSTAKLMPIREDPIFDVF